MRIAPQSLHLVFPKLGEVIFVGLFVTLIFLGPQMMNIDGDLGRHLTIGSYIIDTKTIPTKDIYSHTKFGDPLTPHEWLAQLVFAVFNKIAGLDGVVWLTALVVAGTFWLVYSQSKGRTGWAALSLMFTLLGAATSSLHWLTRPHIFTFFYATVWIGQLEGFRKGKTERWWLLPILMLLWANTHGAFIAGFVLWVMYFAGLCLDGEISAWQDSRPWVLALFFSLLVTGINPVGFHLWGTSLSFLGNEYLVGHTAEYLPPNFQDISTWPFLFMIAISIMLLALKGKRLSSPDMLLLAGWTILGLYSARNIPLYSVVATPVLSGISADTFKDLDRISPLSGWRTMEGRIGTLERELKNGVWAAIVVIAFGLGLYMGMDFTERGNRFQDDKFPVEAAKWMDEEHPQGKIFNYFQWGGYLLYELWPEHLVFIDGQTDFYGEELTREYECVITLCPQWDEIVDKYQIGWVIMPTGSGLPQALNDEPTWKIAYQDQTSIVFQFNGK